MPNTNDIIKLLQKLGFKIIRVDTKKYTGFKAVKVKEVIEMNPTNTEILNAIKDLSTKVDDNYNAINNIKTDINEFRSEVNNRFDNLINKNNLVE